MEPIRFADILFILVVCGVTGAILSMVNKNRKSGSDEKDEPGSMVDKSESSE